MKGRGTVELLIEAGAYPNDRTDWRNCDGIDSVPSTEKIPCPEGMALLAGFYPRSFNVSCSYYIGDIHAGAQITKNKEK